MVCVHYKAVQNMYEENGLQLLENEEPIAMNQPLSFLFCREIAKHVHISISPPHPGGVICNLNAFLAYLSLVSVSWMSWFEGYAVTHFICLFVLFAFATVSPGICNFHKVTHTNITVVQNSQVYNFMFSMEHKDFFLQSLLACSFVFLFL